MELIDQFLEYEHNRDLLSADYEGYNYWMYYRTDIYREIQRIKQNLAASSVPVKARKLARVKNWFLVFARSPMLHRGRCDLLMVSHERRMLIDGKYRPIFFEKILENFEGSFMLLEPRNNENKHYDNESFHENTYYLDEMQIVYPKIYYRLHKNPKEDFCEAIKEMISGVNKEFSVDIDIERWTKIMYRGYINYRCSKRYFRRLLKKVHPKAIVYIVSYNPTCMTLAETAKEFNIPTFELQHGVMGYHHVSYNFFEKVKLPQLPDKVLTFADYWGKVTRFPQSKEAIIPIGFPHMESMIEKYKNTTASKSQTVILFISQRAIGRQLSKFAIALADEIETRKLPYKIVYKLHPQECNDWETSLPELYVMRERIDVAFDYTRPIYQYFAEASVQVAVGSTAIFEGFGFGLETFVYDIPGAEDMHDVCDDGYAMLVDSPIEILENIGKLNSQDSAKFWKSGAVNNFYNAVFPNDDNR